MNRRQFCVMSASAMLNAGWAAAAAGGEEACGEPVVRGDGWSVAPLWDEGLLDRAALCRATARIANAADINIHSLLVARHGKLAFERYFTGDDEVAGRFFGRRVSRTTFEVETLHDMKSVSKSVTSLVFGIARDRGLIRSLDEPVFAYFPELAHLRTPQKDAIQLRHVLSMSMGLAWSEATPETGDLANDEARMNMASDPCAYVLGLPVVTPAGQSFHYNTGALRLISVIIRKVTGAPLDAFARRTLFEPLGISPEWARVRGETDAGGGLRLRPRDMAKIGQLVLSGGRWNGEQLVSRDWIEESSAEKIKATADEAYGYLWWLGRTRSKGRDLSWIGALGRGGQSIRIVPDLDVVVAVTAGYYQDYSPQAFRTQFGVFRDVLAAVPI